MSDSQEVEARIDWLLGTVYMIPDLEERERCLVEAVELARAKQHRMLPVALLALAEFYEFTGREAESAPLYARLEREYGLTSSEPVPDIYWGLPETSN